MADKKIWKTTVTVDLLTEGVRPPEQAENLYWLGRHKGLVTVNVEHEEISQKEYERLQKEYERTQK